MTLRVGDAAPEFTLDGIDGRTGARCEYRLSDGYGKPQIVVFYPADNTPVCTEQLVSYTAGIGELARFDARVLALSPQSLQSHADFAARHGGFAFPLLSDTDARVGEAYGILGLLNLYRRSVFVLDDAGRIRFLHRAIGPGLRFVPIETIAEHLEPISS